MKFKDYIAEKNIVYMQSNPRSFKKDTEYTTDELNKIIKNFGDTVGSDIEKVGGDWSWRQHQHTRNVDNFTEFTLFFNFKKLDWNTIIKIIRQHFNISKQLTGYYTVILDKKTGVYATIDTKFGGDKTMTINYYVKQD